MTRITHIDRRQFVAGGAAALGGLAMNQVWGGSPGYDRTGASPHQSRSVVMGRNGMVATSQPLAVQAGLEVLKAGGNAVDAALAANAVIGVVEPMSCGIGGDLFAIVWEAKTSQLHGLNACGRSPKSLTRQVFETKGVKDIPETGIDSWSVPGCVDGWNMLRERFGSWTWPKLLEAAIAYAKEGFPVSEVIAASWAAGAKSLAEWPESARVYLPDGQAPTAGSVFRNADLAWAYEQIAAGGSEAFYKGEIAERIAAFAKANGAHLTAEDLAANRSNWIDPVKTNYRGVDVWELPPNGQGIAALQMLNMLEPHDLRGMGHNSAEHLHLLIEAKKLAFADRARYYADPEFSPAPVDELISKDYGHRRGRLIDPRQAAKRVPAGDPKLKAGDTIYLTVVDRERNCVSLIQSLYAGFGSRVTPTGVGFAMQNRGCLFSLDPKHPNRLEPGKRPFHTIIPGFATRGDQPYLAFGVMGGDMQPQGHVQVLSNMIDFGMNVQQAGDSARARHEGSDSPTGAVMSDGGRVSVESGVSDAALAGLRERGHQADRFGGSFGGYQAIMLDHSLGVLHGGTDPRKDGCAAGY